MPAGAAVVRVSYLGWSGFHITWPGGPQVVLDPPDAESLRTDQEAWILLSHGHPEHVAGTISYLKDPTRTAPVTVVASSPVCRYFERRHGQARDQFLPCQAGQTVKLPNLQIDAFSWRHMRLLPPGLGPALQHLRHVASRPRLALKIIRKSLWGPPTGAMLGFRLVPEGGPRILWYSEGLHRLTRVDQVQATGKQLEADALLFAIEPEDLHIIAELLSAIGSPVVIPYEAHQPWREGFGMPVVDLARLTEELQEHGLRAPLLAPGHTLTLGDGEP